MRAPFTATVFVLELTHDLNVLPALLVGCVAADAVTVLVMRRSILTEKVARRGHHLTREYGVDPLELVRVGEVMDREPATVPAALLVSELAEKLMRQPLPYAHQAFPIVDDQHRLVGLITRGDVIRALKEENSANKSVLEAGSRDLIVAYPDELLSQAVQKMLGKQIGRLPVVSREDPSALVGYLGRRDIMAARLRQLNEERVRERIWSIRPPIIRPRKSDKIS